VEFDDALIVTGSRPRVPAWAEVDGELVLTSREACGLAGTPEHAVVVGDGSTGVEFARIFSSLRGRVTLPTARERVLPRNDEKAAAAGGRVRVSRLVFGANPQALIQTWPRGFVKMLGDPRDDRVLGGTVVGRHAAELIGIFALSLRAGVARSMVAETLMAYPSLAGARVVAPLPPPSAAAGCPRGRGAPPPILPGGGGGPHGTPAGGGGSARPGPAVAGEGRDAR
jgi:pyruvate/2-oxoglutarate dehydrogenase complex dihydrolipoamide dehydrogenase (E3) component